MIRFSIFLFFVLLAGSASRAQSCNEVLRGIVTNEQDQTLPGATITIDAGAASISSDDGSFTFTGLCQGRVVLTVEYVGFEKHIQTVSLPVKRTITIRLKSLTTELEGVVVEGDRRMNAVSQTTSLLSKKELESLHGRPLGESLKEIPGVSAIQTGPSIFKPVIHGLHSQRILILNNGIRQEGQQWGIEHAPEVDPYIASSLEVVKGAETVRYGYDAIGGVIIVNPPALHEVENLGGEINVGFMSNNRMGVISAMLEGHIAKNDKLSWRLQTSAKKGGDYHAAKYNLSNTGTQEFNFSGALGFKDAHRGFEVYVSSFNTTLGILRAAHTGNLQDIQTSIESGRPWYVQDFSYTIENPKQRINHQLLKLKSYFDVKNFGRINLLYGGQYNERKEFDIRRSGRSDRPALSMSLFSNVLDVSLDHEKGEHSGSIGINSTLKFNKNDTDLTGITPLIPNYNQASAGLFVLEKLRRNRWTFEAGGRYDYQYLEVLTFNATKELVKPSFDFNFFSGTVGVAYKISQQWRYISNFGISSRPPHVSELYSEGLHHGTGSIEEGLMRPSNDVLTDQSLIRKEMSKKWINTLQFGGENLTMDFSVYYNRMDNYVFIRPYETRLTIRGYFPVFRFDQTDAVLMGSDFGLKWDINNRFTYATKVSYVHATDVKNDDKLIFIPPALFDNSVTLNFPNVDALEGLHLTVSAPYTFQQTRAPRAVYPEDIPNDTSNKVFDLAPAPEGFVMLNASVGFDIPIGEKELAISLSGENLLNKSYRNYMNRLRYFADDTGRNFIVRLSYNFSNH
ncbi:MAG TPA: TonB-dependent receptor [Chryseosolibacter sp.]